MINAIPILGWFISLAGSISLAVPFWLLWTACSLGTTYFYWLPTRYQSIPFWHCVGLFIIASILRSQIPKLASVDQKVEAEEKKQKS